MGHSTECPTETKMRQIYFLFIVNFFYGLSTTALPDLPYQRIISLAPSITEILYALDLGDQVIGVTRYCEYPKTAQAKEKIGGFYDMNYEKILSLKPDLIIMLKSHAKIAQDLKKFALPIQTADHHSIAGIIDSILQIGSICGKKEKAEQLVQSIQTEMDRIADEKNIEYKPKILIVVGREIGLGQVRDSYIAGQDEFYDEMIQIAGGQNAYTGNLPYPMISLEGILTLKPDIILEFIPHKAEIQKAEADWQKHKNILGNVPVIILNDDYIFIPGPRFILTLKKIKEIIKFHIDFSYV